MLRVVLLFSLCATVLAYRYRAPKVTVFANRVKLHEGNSSTNIEYRYFEGDAVEVVCTTSFSDAKISYDYVDPSLMPTEGWREDMSISGRIVGLRVTLRAEHNQTHVTCTSTEDGIKTTVIVTFIVKAAVPDVMNLKINGLALRPQNMQNTSYVVYFTCLDTLWEEIEYMVIESGTSSSDVVLESYQYRCDDASQQFARSTTTSRVMTKYDNCLRYEARNKTTMAPLRTVDIQFQDLNSLHYFSAKYNLLLTFDDAENNDTIELFEVNNNKKIYYNYLDGESLTFNCLIDNVHENARGIHLEFDGQAVENIKHMELSSSDHNKILKCASSTSDGVETASIRVYLRQINASTAIVKSAIDKQAKHIKVLVNRADIYEGNNSSNIEYRYLDGDTVDVTCIGTISVCPLAISYHYVDDRHIDKASGNMSVRTDGSNPGAGVRLTLRATHDGSYVICKCISEQLTDNITLTFVLEEAIDDVMNFKINDLPLRLQNNQDSKYFVYYLRRDVKQWYQSNSLRFDCNASNDIVLETYKQCASCPYITPVPQRSNTSTQCSKSINHQDQVLALIKLDKTTNLPLRTIDIRVERINNFKIETPSLQLNVLQADNMIVLYTWDGDSVMHYNYEDGDSVRMICISSENYDYPGFHYLNFNGTVGSGYLEKHAVTTINLTAADNNSTLTCELKYGHYFEGAVMTKTISLLFRRTSK